MQRLPPTGSSPVAGCVFGIAATGATVAALLPFRGDLSRATPALLLVLAVVGAGVIGGSRAAVLTAVVSAAAFNVAFIPPYGTLTIDKLEDYIALAVLLIGAVAVGLLVANQADRRRGAEHRG